MAGYSPEYPHGEVLHGVVTTVVPIIDTQRKTVGIYGFICRDGREHEPSDFFHTETATPEGLGIPGNQHAEEASYFIPTQPGTRVIYECEETVKGLLVTNLQYDPANEAIPVAAIPVLQEVPQG
jgi:hypothetical protein